MALSFDFVIKNRFVLLILFFKNRFCIVDFVIQKWVCAIDFVTIVFSTFESSFMFEFGDAF